MKVGGNQSAIDFFNKKGGASLLRESDVKKKYSSEVASLYLEELGRRKQEDTTYFPDRIYVEGAEATSEAPAAEAEDDDFFSNWDKPAPSPSPQPTRTATSTAAPPSIGRPAAALSPSATSTAPSPSSTTTSPPPAVAPASRTVSSSSLSSARTPRPSRLGAARTSSPANTGSGAGSTSRPARLGARKAATPIDFDAAERKAKQEEELKAKKAEEEKLAKEKELEEALKKAEDARKAAEDAKAKGLAAASSTIAKSPTTPSSATNGKGASATTNYDMERLGMGMRKMAFGSSATNSSKTGSGKKYPNYDNDTPMTAREKFGGQKAISSDMYFERNTYDPATVSEAQTRLQSFQGATSISSSAYFGRDEEEELEAARGPAGGGGDGLANLEASARDMAQRFLSNPDVQNAADNIRAGALKLGEYLAQFGER